MTGSPKTTRLVSSVRGRDGDEMRNRQREKIDAQWARCFRQYAKFLESMGSMLVLGPRLRDEMERLGKSAKTRAARRCWIRGMGDG